MSRTMIHGNSATSRQSSQTSTCEHCDGYLTARRGMLNGGFFLAVESIRPRMPHRRGGIVARAGWDRGNAFSRHDFMRTFLPKGGATTPSPTGTFAREK